MQCEILEYQTEQSWDIDPFLSNIRFKQLIEPSWPLITTTFSTITPDADQTSILEYKAGKKRSKPSLLRNSTVHSTISFVAEKLGLTRQVLNVHAACASSLYALYMASLLSLENRTPVVVFFGDRANDYLIWHFKCFGACDQNSGRPFDKSSLGFRMGSGMAVFIVKHPSIQSILAPKALMESFAFYTKPELVAHPGLVNDIISNLAHVNYTDIDLWNAHATGTAVGDLTEYNYFSQVCKQDIPIVSFKGYLGHCMAAAGAMEIAMALDCKKNNTLLPNIIHAEKIVDDNRIITKPTSFTYKKMFKSSLGFGGKTIVSKIELF